jgi:hypothetical protein
MPKQKKVKYELAEPTVADAIAGKAEKPAEILIAKEGPKAEQAVSIDASPERGRGRPKGSKNKPKIILAATAMEQPPVMESEAEARRRELAAKAMNLGELKREKPMSAAEVIERSLAKDKAKEEEWKSSGGAGIKKTVEALVQEKVQASEVRKKLQSEMAKTEAEKIAEKLAAKRAQSMAEAQKTAKELGEYIKLRASKEKAEQKAKIAQFKEKIEEGKRVRQEVSKPTPEEIARRKEAYRAFLEQTQTRAGSAEMPPAKVELPQPPMKKLGLWQRARQLGSAIWEDIMKTWNRGRPDKRNK